MFNIHKSPLAWNKPYYICQHGYQVGFHFSIGAAIYWEIFGFLICYLTGCLLTIVMVFWELLCQWYCELEVVVSLWQSPSALYPVVFDRNTSAKVECKLRADFMAFSVAGSNSRWLFPEGMHLCRPSQVY
jgi:hypothetical protein